MPAHVSEIIDTWIPRRNNHTFIRLLLAFPKLTKPHKSLVVDIFGNAAHLFNAGNHGPKLSLSDILQTAETFFRWPAYKTTSDSPKRSSHCRLKKNKRKQTRNPKNKQPYSNHNGTLGSSGTPVVSATRDSPNLNADDRSFKSAGFLGPFKMTSSGSASNEARADTRHAFTDHQKDLEAVSRSCPNGSILPSPSLEGSYQGHLAESSTWCSSARSSCDRVRSVVGQSSPSSSSIEARAGFSFDRLKSQHCRSPPSFESRTSDCTGKTSYQKDLRAWNDNLSSSLPSPLEGRYEGQCGAAGSIDARAACCFPPNGGSSCYNQRCQATSNIFNKKRHQRPNTKICAQRLRSSCFVIAAVPILWRREKKEGSRVSRSCAQWTFSKAPSSITSPPSSPPLLKGHKSSDLESSSCLHADLLPSKKARCSSGSLHTSQEDFEALSTSSIPSKGRSIKETCEVLSHRCELASCALPSCPPSKKARCSTSVSRACRDFEGSSLDRSQPTSARIHKRNFHHTSDTLGIAAPASLQHFNILPSSCSGRFGSSALCSTHVSNLLSKTASSQHAQYREPGPSEQEQRTTMNFPFLHSFSSDSWQQSHEQEGNLQAEQVDTLETQGNLYSPRLTPVGTSSCHSVPQLHISFSQPTLRASQSKARFQNMASLNPLS